MTLLNRKLAMAGCFSALLTGAAVSAPKAYAGFEWTPAPVVKPDDGPVVSAVPVPDVAAQPPMDGGFVPADRPAIDAVPLPPPPIAALKTSPPQTEARDYAVAEGFGRDIPLALVMQQVVPPGYAYSFDTGINPGLRVSWNGGKPWNEVLQEAVSPFHIGVTVVDMTVWLRPAADESAVAPPAELTPVPASAAPLAEHDDSAATPSAMPEKTHGMITDPAQLAAIGRDDAGYQPSYPRRVPLPMAESVKKAEISPPSTLPAATSAPQPIRPSATDLVAAPQTSGNPFAESVPAPVPVSVPQPQKLSRGDEGNSSPAMPDSSASPLWQAEKDASLKETLARWAEDSGVNLYWSISGDYRLPKAIRMHGSFPDAVTEALSAYGDSPDRPFGRLHPNLPDGPAVLIIQSSGAAAAVN